MKKGLSLILALLLLTSAAVGCSEKDVQDNSETTNTTNSETAADETNAETEEETVGFVEDNIPDTLKYGGATVNILGWTGPAETEFCVDEMNGEIVNDAIYGRNTTVEDRLEVQLAYNLIPGANAERQAWCQTVTTSVAAGDAAFDIVAGYSMSGASLAVSGVLQDIQSLDNIDLTKPWWPSSLTKEATCNGKLYFCSGDISPYMIYYMYGTYFNKQLLNDYSLENPYELVNSGKWTIDKMISMSNGIYSDTDGDGNKSIADTFGYTTCNIFTDSFYFASGLKTTTLDENGTPIISSDFGSEKTHDLIVKLVDFFGTNDAHLEPSSPNTSQIFSEGRALFTSHEFTLTVNFLRNTELEYGILPMPKYDEAQSEYYTIMAFPYSLYGVPIDVKAPDMSAAVLECLASEGYRQVSPALFETGFKVKYATDNESAAMFDIIRSSIVFDFGRIFNDSMSSLTWSLFRSSVVDKDTNWASKYKSNKKVLEKSLQAVVKNLSEDNN